jgi:protein-arginine kinase activator protein McsA
MNETHDCPICSEKVAHSERYPRQVCERCASKASDAYGRRLTFSNETLSGGFRAFYRDNGAEYHHQICYIDGRKCFIGEHRFGGIVIEIVKD